MNWLHKRVVASAAVCLLGSLATAAIAQATYEFNLPPQSMADALRSIGQRAAINILFKPKAVKDLTAPALRGVLSPEEAIKRVIAGTNLVVERTATNALLITPARSASKKESADTAEVHTTRWDAMGLRLAQTDPTRLTDASAPQEWAPRIVPASGASTAKEPAQLEEVIVTAQKRSQRLLDVPVSIAALSGEELHRAGVDTLLDLSHAVPGLVVGDAGGGFIRYFVRGVSNIYGSFSTALTGVYLDEADVTGSSTTQLDLRTQDIERVEVLKGPQGTLYGAGSSGGTVRFITRDPKLDRFTASGTVDLYGTEGGSSSQAASAVVNIPIISDVLGVRLVGNYGNIGGWVDQPAAGRSNVNTQYLKESRVKALWKPIDNLTVKPMIYVHRNHGGGIASGTDEHYVLETAVDPMRPLPFSTDYDVYNLTATYDFRSVRILSSSTYVDNLAVLSLSQKYATDPPPAPLFEAFSDRNRTSTKTFSQELRLGSLGDGRFNWTGGVFYKHLSYQNEFMLDVAQGGVLLGTFPVFGQEDSKSGSVFGDATFSLTPRAELGAGVRYFKDDLSSFDGTLRREGHFHSIDPRLHFSYGIAPDIRAYASAADGFRSGGFNIESGNLSTFSPEKVRSYELGLKFSMLDHRLAGEAALFYSKYRDIQLFRLVGNNFGQIDNGGDARIQGVDVSLQWQATQHLQLQFSGNYTDGQLRSVASDAITVLKGDPLDFSTDYAINAGGTYSFQWTAATPGFVRLDFSRLGPSNVTDRSIPYPIIFRSAVNNLLGARIGLRHKHWSVELYGTNLTGENRLQDPNGGYGFGARPRPRTFGVQLGAEFE
jgi:outer membrane receptor protein involved in Fe transport